ncbi:MAG TPA: Wzz/FepE/Etk N-terminal domain-containing protein [Bacteroidales bacterium]|nr:Wzz/FepE/Etk N-terminal domain-containing protein [Bacteroidales bacterium]
MQESEQENIFSSANLFKIIIQNKKILIIVCIISFLFSVFLCFYLPPKYRSTVVLFPTSSSSISQALITESQQKKDILKFGEEEDVEQLMQVLQSSEIRKRIIQKYNLYSHYRIDPDSKYANTQMYKKYESNVNISRTEFMSIEIEVFDEDPEKAALIANDIAALVDSLFAKIQKERATKAFNIVEKEFLAQKNKIKAIEDSLSVLSKLGVIDVKSQTEMYSEQHAIAIANGNEKAKIEIEKKLDILATYGSSHSILKEQMFEEVKQLSIIEAKYREAKIDMEQNLPNTYIVSPAEVSDKKHSPIYWLTISVTVLSTFLFSLVVLIFIDKFIKKKVQVISQEKLQT